MSGRTLAFVGSLTRDTPFFEPARGPGLAVFSFDDASGALELLSETSGADNPTYLAVDPERRFLCATSEVYEWHEGVVTGYTVDPASGRLLYRNKQPTLGHLSAFVSLDRSGRNILVSNYSMQTADVAPGQCLVVLPVGNGLIGPVADSVTRAGSGPVADRQERSHAHCLLEMTDGRLVTADLGTDEVAFYSFDAVDGTMSRAPVATVALPPGSGPRHLVWSRDGLHLYVVNELASTLSVVARHDAPSAFRVVQTISTLPPDRTPSNRAAGVAITPAGRFLYASNRGDDSVMAFRIAPATGLLQQIGAQSSGGRTPRSFDIDPAGRFLVVANQDGHNLTVLAIHPDTGALSDAGIQVPIGSPTCVRIVRFPES
jgi:6-phosphogluconolactonase